MINKEKMVYWMTVVSAVLFLIYVTYMNFIYDPQAVEFLAHKEGQKRPVQTKTWLIVMYVHVIAASIAMISGMINFSRITSGVYRRFHRINGYVYFIGVLIAVLTSGYMAPYATGGKPSSIAFNMLNMYWPLATGIAIVKIRSKKLLQHRQWMLRSYVFCFTNLFIHTLNFALHNGVGLSYEVSYTISVYGAILTLTAVSEMIIRCLPTSFRGAR